MQYLAYATKKLFAKGPHVIEMYVYNMHTDADLDQSLSERLFAGHHCCTESNLHSAILRNAGGRHP